MAATTTVYRDQLSAAIDDEMRQWDDLVAEVGLSSLNLPGFMGEWTFLDVASHLTAWRRRTISRLDAAAHGLPEPEHALKDNTEAEADASNQRIYEQEHGRAAVDILHEAHDSYEQLKRVVDGVPIDEIADPNRFSWLEGRSLNDVILDRSLFEHFHVDHEADIRKRLAELQ
jgi:hypothetical protein